MNIRNNLHSNNTNYPQPVVIRNTNVVPSHYGNTEGDNRIIRIIPIVIFFAVLISVVVVVVTQVNNNPNPSFDFDGFDSNF